MWLSWVWLAELTHLSLTLLWSSAGYGKIGEKKKEQSVGKVDRIVRLKKKNRQAVVFLLDGGV